jgi:hypothetical protein
MYRSLTPKEYEILYADNIEKAGYDPQEFVETMRLTCEKVCKIAAEITMQEVMEKWMKGRKEHNDILGEINAEAELRQEIIDAFWYTRILQVNDVLPTFECPT